jgi:hypothetical protein
MFQLTIVLHNDDPDVPGDELVHTLGTVTIAMAISVNADGVTYGVVVEVTVVPGAV